MATFTLNATGSSTECAADPGEARHATLDAHEAVARVAYALSELAMIYPITPSSPMGESADAWAVTAKPNLWGDPVKVVEM